MRKRKAFAQRLRGIYRIDLPGKRMDGWQVHISRNRRAFLKYFSNLAHGGTQAALRAAIRYRDRIEREHEPLSRAEYAAIMRRNNTSGIPGVYRYPVKGKRARWIAFWVPEPGGKPRGSKFSVERYGEARAKEMAIAARRTGLEEMTGFWVSRGKPRPRKPGARREPVPDARIARVAVGEKRLTVTLRDERLVSVPLRLVPKLAKADQAARQAFRLSEDKRSIEWPALGLRFVPQDLLAGKF